MSERVGPPLAASFRDLWRPLGVRLLSSLFSLLSSLFSLLLVVVVLRRLDPMRRVTHSTHDKPCQLSCCCSELEPLALSALFSLLSSLSALFPLLSLPLISQTALRTCPFHLCIRLSNPFPTASTLCGTTPRVQPFSTPCRPGDREKRKERREQRQERRYHESSG